MPSLGFAVNNNNNNNNSNNNKSTDNNRLNLRLLRLLLVWAQGRGFLYYGCWFCCYHLLLFVHFCFTTLSNCKVVFVPAQRQQMMFSDLYAMHMPLFVPGARLMARTQQAELDGDTHPAWGQLGARRRRASCRRKGAGEEGVPPPAEDTALAAPFPAALASAWHLGAPHK
ncbi:unnamed protein product, partial [Polarella glacialis]